MSSISSLPPIMVCGVGGRLVSLVSLGDDDNLQQLCFVTHGLRTPVSWMGSRTSIAVAAMASVLRGPTVAGPSLEVHDLYVVRFRRKVHFEERKQANQKRVKLLNFKLDVLIFVFFRSLAVVSVS
ncbi:hypothetical protein Tco_0714928 [Tanacetum coccineum]